MYYKALFIRNTRQSSCVTTRGVPPAPPPCHVRNFVKFFLEGGSPKVLNLDHPPPKNSDFGGKIWNYRYPHGHYDIWGKNLELQVPPPPPWTDTQSKNITFVVLRGRPVKIKPVIEIQSNYWQYYFGLENRISLQMDSQPIQPRYSSLNYYVLLTP